jgi:hypothetical protein
MNRVLKLAVVILVGGVTGAGAAYQSAEQPRAATAPSNFGLRIAQNGCYACNMLYQQGAAQCQAFRYNYQQYRYCMTAVQQNAGQCMQACAGGGYPGPGRNVPLCQQFPNNPACR